MVVAEGVVLFYCLPPTSPSCFFLLPPLSSDLWLFLGGLAYFLSSLHLSFFPLLICGFGEAFYTRLVRVSGRSDSSYAYAFSCFLTL